MYTAPVPALSERLTLLPFIWTTGLLLLVWPSLPPARRRVVALLTSAAGIAFLVVALGTEGRREAPVTASYLVGTPEVTGHAAASASLPYYVGTAVCLFLGTLGLAVRDDDIDEVSRHWVATAIGVSLLVTAVRFALEKVAAPPLWTWAVGITWLAPVVGGFFAARSWREGLGFRALLAALATYAVAVRAAVASVMVAASMLRLGTHYDVSRFVKVRHPWSGEIEHFTSGSLRQVIELAVLPQMLFWPVWTMLTGLMGAGATLLVLAARQRAARAARTRPQPELGSGVNPST